MFAKKRYKLKSMSSLKPDLVELNPPDTFALKQQLKIKFKSIKSKNIMPAVTFHFNPDPKASLPC